MEQEEFTYNFSRLCRIVLQGWITRGQRARCGPAVHIIAQRIIPIYADFSLYAHDPSCAIVAINSMTLPLYYHPDFTRALQLSEDEGRLLC